MTLDLHGMTYEQAKAELDTVMKKLPTDTRELTVIHGYHGGTVLRDLVRNYRNPKIERKLLSMNNGSTVFIIKKKELSH